MPPVARRKPLSSRAAVYASEPEEDERVREGVEASERGEGIELTERELTDYGKTGILPERVRRWFASRS
jgi:hypothetical protein